MKKKNINTVKSETTSKNSNLLSLPTVKNIYNNNSLGNLGRYILYHLPPVRQIKKSRQRHQNVQLSPIMNVVGYSSYH